MAGSLPLSGVQLVAQNAGQFISQMSGADKALSSFGKGAGAMSQIVTGAFRQVGAIITNVLADTVRAVGSWVKDSIGVAGDFEETLNIMGATSGATAEQLGQVAAKAKELGADLELPATSANEAAEVMLELSKAGFSVQESMDAAKGALLLAAAADTDAATATGILTGAINAFGLEATEAVRIADLLAAGANASSASMTDLGAGLQQAGFAFAAAGLPVEDLITSLAALTNVGLTGSDAGTALKNAMMRLMDPTDKAAKLMAELGFSAYDATGQMKPLPTLIGDLNRAMAGMTEEERNATLGNIFLSDGMKAMIPLLDLGTDGFFKLKEQVTEEGAAAEVAAARMKGWNGAVASTKSQLETLQLVIGGLLRDALTPLLFKVAEFIPKVTIFAERVGALAREVAISAEPFRKFLFALMVLNPSLIGIVGAVFQLQKVLTPIIASIFNASSGTQGLTTALTTLFGPLGATTGSIAAATLALQEIWAAIQKVGLILAGEFTGSVSGAQGALASVVNFVLGTLLPALATAASWFATNLPAGIAIAKGAFAELGTFIGTLMPTIVSIITTALTIIQTFWQQNGAMILSIVTSTWEAIKGVVQIVLGAIQGILAITLGLMTGDFQSQMGTIQQANTTIWNGIRQFLFGLLNAIAALFGTTLDEIGATWQHNFDMLNQITARLMGLAAATVLRYVNDIRSFIASVIASAVSTWNSLFGELGSTVSSVMSSAASIVDSKVASIKGAFSGIVGAINSVISAAKRLSSTLSSINLPDWLTPGSPTPFEIGLKGIDKAMKQVTSTVQASFSPALGSVPAALPPMQSGNTTNTTYGPSYQMPIYTNQSPAVLSQGLALVQAVSR